MSGKDLIFQRKIVSRFTNMPKPGTNQKQVVSISNDYSTTRARAFKVRTTSPNYTQYVATINAYAQAGLPFEDIANAGQFLGDDVEKGEVDAPLQGKPDRSQGKLGEVIEDEDKILAWQSRGEKISLIQQLAASSNLTTGKEVVIVSESLVVSEPIKEQTIDVLEGITVLRQENVGLPKPSSEGELENNPFLQGPAGDFKKAA